MKFTKICLMAALAMFVTAAESLYAGEAVKKAICVVQPTEGSKCHGTVVFECVGGGKVKVTAKIAGLNPKQKHAIHIHEFGDVTDLSGKSAGGHYNPTEQPHGLPPAAKRHAGDLGNLSADAKGQAEYSLTVKNITIGGDKAPILGRAIVVHAGEDDGGQPTGNAGARIGFGVIGVAKVDK